MKSTLFFIGPILATFLGMYTVYSINVPISVFYPNLISTLISIPSVIFIAPRWHNIKSDTIDYLSLFSIFLLLICFLFSNENEVYRWIKLGPLSLNISMMILPLVLFCLNQMLVVKKILYSFIIFGIISTILCFQPDAGQATVFSLSALVIFLYNKINIKLCLTAIIISSLTIYLTWHQIDLLEPISYVEDILHLIKGLGFIGLAGIIIVLLFLFLPFAFMSFNSTKPVKILSISFIVYLLSSLLITEFGHFPVPVIGAGFSSVFGWFLMLSFIYKPNN